MGTMRIACPHPANLVRRWRQPVELVIHILLGAVLVRGWFVEPFVVPTGSMAQTLLGLHAQLACDRCGFTWPCDAFELEEEAQFAGAVQLQCPNCAAVVDAGRFPVASGDRLLADKLSYDWRAPRRWEVVVFRHPEDPWQSWVKRLVGLPGETVQLRDGNVYIDGKLLRKPLSHQRALAVLVHDDAHRPGGADDPAVRWRGEPDTRWTATDDGWEHPGGAADGPPDWLEYRHLVRYEDELVEAALDDETPYSPFSPRVLQPVREILLALDASIEGAGSLWLRAHDGHRRFEVRFDPAAGQTVVQQDGRHIHTGPLPEGFGRGWQSIELSLVDQQFSLAVEGEVLAELPFESPRREPVYRPVAVGAQGAQVRLRRLRLYRDVYYAYTPDTRWAFEEPVVLGPDEYFVLGDNSPASGDSRIWPRGPGVPRSCLVGRALWVHYPSQVVPWGGWNFHVPKLGAIRYIR